MDTESKLKNEEVMYQQTYDYTWEANLEQHLNNVKRMIINLKGNNETECPASVRADVVALISQMKFFLNKYKRDISQYDESLSILDNSTSISVYDAVLSDMESAFALEAGYVLNFRAKTDRREDWETFL